MRNNTATALGLLNKTVLSIKAPFSCRTHRPRRRRRCFGPVALARSVRPFRRCPPIRASPRRRRRLRRRRRPAHPHRRRRRRRHSRSSRLRLRRADGLRKLVRRLVDGRVDDRRLLVVLPLHLRRDQRPARVLLLAVAARGADAPLLCQQLVLRGRGSEHHRTCARTILPALHLRLRQCQHLVRIGNTGRIHGGCGKQTYVPCQLGCDCSDCGPRKVPASRRRRALEDADGEAILPSLRNRSSLEALLADVTASIAGGQLAEHHLPPPHEFWLQRFDAAGQGGHVWYRVEMHAAFVAFRLDKNQKNSALCYVSSARASTGSKHSSKAWQRRGPCRSATLMRSSNSSSVTTVLVWPSYALRAFRNASTLASSLSVSCRMAMRAFLHEASRPAAAQRQGRHAGAQVDVKGVAGAVDHLEAQPLQRRHLRPRRKSRRAFARGGSSKS